MLPEDYQGMIALLSINSGGSLHRMLAEGNYGCVKTIDVIHALSHDGKVYGHSNIHRTLAAGSEHLHVLRVTSDGAPHLLVPYITATGAPVEVRLYENTQVSSFGTAAQVFNHNRAMPNSSEITVYENSVVSSVGQELFARSSPGTVQSGAEYNFESDEWILLGGTVYAVGVTNKTVQSVDYSIVHKWAQP